LKFQELKKRLLERLTSEGGALITDPQLRFHLVKVDKLPEAARNLIISTIKSVIISLEARIRGDEHG